MKTETLVSKMIPQTCNLMSSGGSAFEALTAGDIQGLLMSCNATPLIWSFFEAKHMINNNDTTKYLISHHKKESKDEDGNVVKERWTDVKKIEHGHAYNDFYNKLVVWLYNRIINEQHRREAIKLDYIIKNHKSALNAAYELSEGLCGYLARHKISDDKYGTYFKIEKSKFSRYYRDFINDCACDLETQLNNLERQIKEKTNNN